MTEVKTVSQSHNSDHKYEIRPRCTCGWEDTELVHSRTAADDAFGRHFVDCIKGTRS